MDCFYVHKFEVFPPLSIFTPWHPAHCPGSQGSPAPRRLHIHGQNGLFCPQFEAQLQTGRWVNLPARLGFPRVKPQVCLRLSAKRAPLSSWPSACHTEKGEGHFRWFELENLTVVLYQAKNQQLSSGLNFELHTKTSHPFLTWRNRENHSPACTSAEGTH